MNQTILELSTDKRLLSKLKKDQNLVNKLKSHFIWVESIYELVWCIKNHIFDKPICCIDGCEKKANFLYYQKSYQILGYSLCCSKKHNMVYTCQQKYGHNITNPMQTAYIKKKLNNVMLEKYGVQHVSKIDGIQEKINTTNLKRYGVKRPTQSTSIMQKSRENMIQTYGVDNICKISILNVIENNSDKVKPLFDFKTYAGYDKFHNWQCVKCSKIFSDYMLNRTLPRCPNCFPKNKSRHEHMLLNYLKQYKITIKENYRNFEKKEADIYVVDKNLAIEINGNYWHTETNGKDKNYHLDKTLSYIQENIQLIHIFEDEIIFKEQIVKSIISAKLKYFEIRIPARKCVIREIDEIIKNNFLKENHLEGIDISKIKLGLFYIDELIGVMTFDESNLKNNWNMQRFCTKLNHQIIGGASKLWAYFLKKYKPLCVQVQVDRRYSKGDVFEKMGFSMNKVIMPEFFILGKNKLDRLSQKNYTSDNLKKILNVYDETISEWENLDTNGYDRIWNCGYLCYIWKNNCKIS